MLRPSSDQRKHLLCQCSHLLVSLVNPARGVSVESFSKTSQDNLLEVVASVPVIEVPEDDVRVPSGADRGARLLEAGMSMVFAVTDTTTGASAAAVAAAKLMSATLAQAGLVVVQIRGASHTRLLD